MGVVNRLDKLKALEAELRAAMDDADARTLAPLAKQYRETIREIEELENDNGELDEITRILANRQANSNASN